MRIIEKCSPDFLYAFCKSRFLVYGNGQIRCEGKWSGEVSCVFIYIDVASLKKFYFSFMCMGVFMPVCLVYQPCVCQKEPDTQVRGSESARLAWHVLLKA